TWSLEVMSSTPFVIAQNLTQFWWPSGCHVAALGRAMWKLVVGHQPTNKICLIYTSEIVPLGTI
ncbi:hypothetical protein, partial [Peribacillus simplex]|uniref:hypothetical protein n=1 Tax=Peribacillus simplex TaxID=1478 RepID=UPI003CFA2749